MRIQYLLVRACVTGTLVLGSLACGGWKWTFPH